MSANRTTAGTSVNETVIVAYYSLGVTITGTIFNILTFTVLCRPTFRNSKVRPTLHYMRAIAIFDILMLYGWNLDHYLLPMYGFAIQTSSIPLCRFLSFFNYFVCQSSAWLRVVVCVDRYVTLSRLHQTWFSNTKHALIIITCIIGGCSGLNALFFFYGCSISKRGNVLVQSWAFPIYPLWDYVNLIIYNCIPFLLMTLFNSGVIYHLLSLRRTSTIQNSQIQHRSISITLVITTCFFVIMTMPGTIAYAFLYTKTSATLRRFLDGILYTYHILSFPLYMVTFDQFRGECITIIKCGQTKPHATSFAPMQPYLASIV